MGAEILARLALAAQLTMTAKLLRVMKVVEVKVKGVRLMTVVKVENVVRMVKLLVKGVTATRMIPSYGKTDPLPAVESSSHAWQR